MTTTTPLRFPRRAHLRASAEFQVVFGEGKRISGACFRLHAHVRSDATQARVGVAVSKRVDKAAVGRNRVRRQINETFRQHRAGLPHGDFVFVAKPEAKKADNAALRRDLLSLLDRARTLKPMAPTGTMPPSAANLDRNSTDA